jgi:N-acetylglutamate synthase-like GNAT family acetyltransferase
MDAKNIIIREFKSMDSLELCAIIKKNLVEVNSKDYPEDIINSMCNLYTPNHIIKMAKERDIYVAELNGNIIGTASLDKNIICTVFVNTDYHRHGVGRKLISFIEDTANKNSVKTIQIHSSLTSQDFYYALGYLYVKQVDVPNLGRSIIVEKQL